MKIKINSVSFHANDKIIDFANDKIKKLGQYSEQVLEARVALKVVKSDTMNNKICEIKLVIPGNDLFARKQCESFEEAILNASDAMKQQLLTWKEKLN